MKVEHNQSRKQPVKAFNILMNEGHLWGEQGENDKEKSNKSLLSSKNTANHPIISDETQTQTLVDVGSNVM